MALRLARTGSEKAILASARLDRLKIVSNDPSDFSSSMDYEINELIVSGLQKAYPTHTIKSRIGESIIGLDTEPSWLIDPLFGSLNFFKGTWQPAGSLPEHCKPPCVPCLPCCGGEG